MSQDKKRTRPEEGVTIISLIPDDASKFHNRLLISGLRLSTGQADVGLYWRSDGGVISATGPGCTGYLLATDEVEASESDLFRFLLEELGDGQGLNIFGRYRPEPDKTVQSWAHFRQLDGRIMSSEKRLLTTPDGAELLRNRSDLGYDNVTPLIGPDLSSGLIA
jgi:hypothetical protein